ncbi:TPA: diguanylate cyclase [Candidatus Avigastranaerophilus faecigallinarum]|nr:diguanylate cyclase [Candidatus Avigastranaerophilus faecigallinarum]
MNIFSGFKDLLGQINKIDGSIYLKGKDFADVYAKNIALEEEIAARTKELEQANQTILTLNSVWDMMNSSQPLSSMLDKIVSILHEDMNYHYAGILKIEYDENNKAYFSVKSSSSNKSIDKLFEMMNESLETYKLPYVSNSIVVKAISERKIFSTPDLKGIINMFFPLFSEEQIKYVMSEMNSKTCTVVPLFNGKEDFGCVIVSSDRDGITDTETNFLALFANQIELAITVAGLFEEVKKQAITDPLTGIYNRRYFEENIMKEAERSLRLKQPFSLISMDLDYLKKINDTYGHQYGDLAIKTIANVLKREARSIDIPARIGGEEFNLLLPGVDSRGAVIAAERIRKSIENQVLDTIGGITASVGVATFLEHSDRIDELMELADQAMYKAKLNGRNQVQIAQKQNEVNWQKVAVETFMDIITKKRIPVDDETARILNQKLKKIKIEDVNTKDVLYSIVDIISQTYNQMYKTGTTKSKIILAVMLAKKLDLPKDEIDKLKLAILLYDIGNIMIPEEIFSKKEPLTDEEKNLIKQHPVIAAREILKPISNIQDIIPIIESHHENWNGEGYPGQKSGIEIPLTSQIVLLVDAFYAMAQDRPYRQAYDIDEILEIIRSESGKQWNEKLVEDFIYVVKNEAIQ